MQRYTPFFPIGIYGVLCAGNDTLHFTKTYQSLISLIIGHVASGVGTFPADLAQATKSSIVDGHAAAYVCQR
jgi:hypothetical protein